MSVWPGHLATLPGTPRGAVCLFHQLLSGARVVSSEQCGVGGEGCRLWSHSKQARSLFHAGGPTAVREDGGGRGGRCSGPRARLLTGPCLSPVTRTRGKDRWGPDLPLRGQRKSTEAKEERPFLTIWRP